MIVILSSGSKSVQHSFVIGSLGVRDVLIDPESILRVFYLVRRILFSSGSSLGVSQPGVTGTKKKCANLTGVAMSGGGLEGFLYQLGCAYALKKAFNGKSICDFSAYSGVSSGSILAAILASEVPLLEVIRSIHGVSQILPPLTSQVIFDFAAGDIFKRVLSLPTGSKSWGSGLLDRVPNGLFKGERLRKYLSHAIESFDQKDHFMDLKRQLFVGATNHDTFQHVVFGLDPWRDLKISDAVRASSALPPFFTPHKINGQSFIDGQITKTCNLELLVSQGCKFIVIIDPLQPYSLEHDAAEKKGGLYTLIQTIKTLVHSRFRTSLTHLTERYPDVDFVVFQPDGECAALMSGSPMRYKIRSEIVELSYRSTLKKINTTYSMYQSKFGRYGFDLLSSKSLVELENGLGDSSVIKNFNLS